eukprot:4923712-Amphidinium_carterae.1
MVDAGATCSSANFAAEEALRLLGIRVSTKSSKRKAFAEAFDMLGVSVMFNQAVKNFGLSIVVANTASRSKELAEELDKIERDGSLDGHEAARLRGRFGFFLSALWSRSGVLFLRALELRAAGPAQQTQLSSHEKFAIQAARRVLEMPPRAVAVKYDRAPAWVFTDAAAEAVEGSAIQKVSIGGVLYLPGEVKPARYFSHCLQESLVRRWTGVGQKQVITQAEVFAVVAAKQLWGSECLQSACCIFGVDNVGAQQALIRMASGTPTMASLLKASFCLDRASMIACWYTWVPSKSNPADAPSRGSLGALVGVRRDTLSDDVLFRT